MSFVPNWQKGEKPIKKGPNRDKLERATRSSKTGQKATGDDSKNRAKIAQRNHEIRRKKKHIDRGGSPLREPIGQKRKATKDIEKAISQARRDARLSGFEFCVTCGVQGADHSRQIPGVPLQGSHLLKRTSIARYPGYDPGDKANIFRQCFACHRAFELLNPEGRLKKLLETADHWRRQGFVLGEKVATCYARRLKRIFKVSKRILSERHMPG